jgi:AraC-like DNA-binding protein
MRRDFDHEGTATVDFSERQAPLFVALDAGAPRRRICRVESVAGATEIERFLGQRLQGFTAVVRVRSGKGRLFGSFGRVAIGEGDVLIVPPGGVSHTFESEHSVDMLALPYQMSTGAVVRSASVPAHLFDLNDESVVELLQRAPHRASLRRSETETTLMRTLEAIRSRPSWARRSRVAHTLGYTADGLTALMRRHTGRTFAEWREALAMASVRSKLTGVASVTSIARELAIDQKYLHRRFLRAHGATPQSWRKSLQPPRGAIAHFWDDVDRFAGGAT